MPLSNNNFKKKAALALALAASALAPASSWADTEGSNDSTDYSIGGFPNNPYVPQSFPSTQTAASSRDGSNGGGGDGDS